MHRYFFKRVNTQKLQSSVQGSRQVQFLVNDGDHQVNAHRYPDLSLHRIGACPIVMLDAQMAFDPAEEQLDTPSQAVSVATVNAGTLRLLERKTKLRPLF